MRRSTSPRLRKDFVRACDTPRLVRMGSWHASNSVRNQSAGNPTMRTSPCPCAAASARPTPWRLLADGTEATWPDSSKTWAWHSPPARRGRRRVGSGPRQHRRRAGGAASKTWSWSGRRASPARVPRIRRSRSGTGWWARSRPGSARWLPRDRSPPSRAANLVQRTVSSETLYGSTGSHGMTAARADQGRVRVVAMTGAGLATAGVKRFISDFCTWAIASGMPPESRRYFPTAIRRALRSDLPSRDGSERIVSRRFAGSNGLRLCHCSESQAFATGSDGDVIGTVRGPVWFGGWNEVSRCDYHIQDTLWHFFLRAASYVARSRLLNGLASIALTYRVGCDDRYMETHERVVTAGDSMNASIAIDRTLPGGSANNRTRILSYWLANVNALDPWVHRAAFHYVRAMRLFNDDYWEDGVTALDACIDVASQFVRDRLGMRSSTPRTMLSSFAGLSKDQANQLVDLHEFRNFFGAHPAPGGWWDVQDHHAEYVVDMLETVERVLRNMVAAEQSVRVVPTTPTAGWSGWFVSCCNVLGPSIWFNFDGPPLLGHDEFMARTGLRGQGHDGRKVGPFGHLAERRRSR